jgi:hypothetical protein
MKIYNRIISIIFQILIEKDLSDQFIRLGSRYGGWSICSCALHIQDNEFYIGAGVGEDISFDIELIHQFNLQGLLIDPTSRANSHIQKYFESPENLNPKKYASGGLQEIDSYISDLKIKSRLRFINMALWIDDAGINLTAPRNTSGVSFHLYDTKFNKKKRHFPTVSQEEIFKQVPKLDSEPKFSIYKLDIEGSELKILRDFVKRKTSPRQLLVEFDFLRGTHNLFQVIMICQLLITLRKKGYRLAHREGLNCTFLNEKLIS